MSVIGNSSSIVYSTAKPLSQLGPPNAPPRRQRPRGQPSPTPATEDATDDNSDSDNDDASAPPPVPSPPRRGPPPPPPSRHQPLGTDHAQRDYDPEMVSRSLSDSFKVLGPGLGVTEIEVKVQYRALSRIYHPDRHDPMHTGLTNEAAADFFELINNAQAYLREVL